MSDSILESFLLRQYIYIIYIHTLLSITSASCWPALVESAFWSCRQPLCCLSTMLNYENQLFQLLLPPPPPGALVSISDDPTERSKQAANIESNTFDCSLEIPVRRQPGGKGGGGGLNLEEPKASGAVPNGTNRDPAIRAHERIRRQRRGPIPGITPRVRA